MTISIRDLHANNELDTRAMAKVRGGWGCFGHYRSRRQPHHGRQGQELGPVGQDFGALMSLLSQLSQLFGSSSLTNVNNQINIAINSPNATQINSNTVVQV